MPHLSISLLGSFQVRLDDKPVAGFESDKVRALLAYLAAEAAQTHQRQWLAGLLWPDYAERSARANLRNVLANLRQAIGDQQATPPFLDITRQTLQFNRQSDHHIDVADLADWYAEQTTKPANIAHLTKIIDLYQGPFLAGFSLPDSAPFEEWALLKREEFGRQMMMALSLLANHYQQQHLYDQALPYIWQQLDLEPWSEEAYQQLMRTLALSGRRSEALAQYEACRKVLAAELDVAPLAETTYLYEEIRAGKLAGQPDQATRPIAIPHNLPVQLTPFVGREIALTDLSQLLTNPEQRLISIVGPGGIGKTRFALEAALAQRSRFQHGVYLVRLAALASAEEIITATAEAMGFNFYEGGNPEAQLLDYLRQKEMLLVLDNFEHLLAGGHYVTAWLQAAPKLKVLVTSRSRLNLSGEQRFPLAGLQFHGEADQPLKPSALPEAVQLFLAQARLIQPGFSINDDNLPYIHQICQSVVGMPLGILLAASWLELLSVAEIAAEITASLDFLANEQLDLPERQHSLRAVFEHSWRLLPARAQAIFGQLSVFRGSFSREAAQAVTGASLHDLVGLTNKSLLNRSPAGGYDVHELLRQYAAEKLSQIPAEVQSANDQHCTFYLTFLSQKVPELHGGRQRAALDEIEACLENVQAAWDWAVAHRYGALLHQAIDGLGYFYEWRCHYHLADQRLGQTVDALAQVNTSPALLARIKALAWYAIFRNHLGFFRHNEQLLQKSLSLLADPLLQEQDIRAERAFVLRELGDTLSNNIDKTRGHMLLKESLDLYRVLDAPWHIAQCLNALFEAEDKEFLVLLAESRQIQVAIGDKRGLANTLGQSGFPLMLRGQLAEGEPLLRQSLKLYQEIGDQNGTIHSLNRLGIGYQTSGRSIDAVPLFEQAIEIAEALGMRANLVGLYCTFSDVESHLGRYASATQHAQMGLNLAYENDNPAGIDYAQWSLGTHLILSDAAEAHRLLQESVDSHHHRGETGRVYSVIATLGLAAFYIGDMAQGRQCLRTVLNVGISNEAAILVADTLSLASLLLLHQKQIEQATEIYALAYQYPRVTTSQRYEDLVGQHITAAAEALPPDVVEAARNRGAKRDLAEVAETLLARL